MKIIKEHWLEIMMLILLVVKLWIVGVQPLYIKGAEHDDALYAREAINIINGRWLGEYNDRILSKGVTAVLFIAGAYKLGISYLMAQQILYFLACVSIIHMLKHVIQKKGALLLCYMILLFNPISYSDAFSFVYRDGVYTALTLFFIAFSFQIFFHYKSDMKKVIVYSIAFGMSLAAIYLCREETSCLLPYLVIATISVLGFILGDKKCQKKRKRILCILGIPSVILFVYIIVISSINYHYYGRFITNDFTSKEFKDAYGALTRIKQENYIKRVPLNEESRNLLYKLSPKFRELQEFFEGAGEKYKNKRTKDYQEGFLYWAVREGAYRLGYYENAKTAEQFYIDLAKEINELCDSRKNRKLSRKKFINRTISTRINRGITNLYSKNISKAINL